MARFKCSIVIPAKNAILILPQVLDMVRRQRTNWPFETIVIDSGSRDGTVEHLRQHGDIRLIEIPSTEFGHGRTRNLGISVADAEFVAFLTHDAVPFDEDWLANLVRTAELDPQIAGVFGRHVARSDASPFTKKDLAQHFAGLETLPRIVSKDLDEARYKSDQGWRQVLHFYSDNNSLLRKSVWQDIPYPDVEFAEDQLWARAIIEAGYKKAYSSDAVVIHSHDYDVYQQFRRAFDESRNFRKYFGYRLTPNPFHMMEAIVRFSFQAFRERIDPEYGFPTWLDRVRRAMSRSALVAGHCAGANHQALPLWLTKRMSLDQRLFDA